MIRLKLFNCEHFTTPRSSCHSFKILYTCSSEILMWMHSK